MSLDSDSGRYAQRERCSCGANDEVDVAISDDNDVAEGHGSQAVARVVTLVTEAVEAARLPACDDEQESTTDTQEGHRSPTKIRIPPKKVSNKISDDVHSCGQEGNHRFLDIMVLTLYRGNDTADALLALPQRSRVGGLKNANGVPSPSDPHGPSSTARGRPTDGPRTAHGRPADGPWTARGHVSLPDQTAGRRASSKTLGKCLRSTISL